MFFQNIISLEDAVNSGALPALETFPCPYCNRVCNVDNSDNASDDAYGISGGCIRIVFPEFTCVCPKTGYPDFASIKLCYLPNKLCLELRSWKLYLNSFRMVGTFHEAVTAHLFKTLTNLLAPKWLLLVGDFYPRGNVTTTVLFETKGDRPSAAGLLIDF